MSFKTNLTPVDFYTAADVYFWEVDNRPILNLADRDDELADELDRRTFIVKGSVSGTTLTTNNLPTGWSLSRTDIGVYTVVHDLNTTKFAGIGTVVSATPGVLTISSITTTGFVISTFNLSGAATDFSFSCLISQYGTG